MFSVTSAHAIVPAAVEPSSASVTVILYGTMSPKAANWPSSGISIVTTGRVLPAVIATLSTPVGAARVGHAQRRGVAARGVVRELGFGAVESTVPSPSKSHA